MNDLEGADNGGPPPPPDPHFVDTIRDFPKYFPPNLSPEEWIDLFIPSHRAEWDAYVEKRKTFKDEYRQWQARKAEIEKGRSEMARSKVFQAWVALREKAWEVERAKWTAEEAAMLSEEGLDVEVTSAVCLGPAKKSKKKGAADPTTAESTSGASPAGTVIQSGDAAPSASSTTKPDLGHPVADPGVSSAPLDTEAVTLNVSAGCVSGPALSFVDGGGDGPTMATDGVPSSMKGSAIPRAPTIDQAATPSVGGVDPVDLEEEARQRRMEEESVASDVSVSQPLSVTERLDRMFLKRAELSIVKARIASEPEGSPEKDRLEKLAKKFRRQLSRRYEAGVAMGKWTRRFLGRDGGTMSLDGKTPEDTESIIKHKLEVVLSPDTNFIWFSFHLDPVRRSGDNWLGQKTRVRSIFRKYDLSAYLAEAEGNERLMTVDVPREAFEAWIVSYGKRAGLHRWKF